MEFDDVLAQIQGILITTERTFGTLEELKPDNEKLLQAAEVIAKEIRKRWSTNTASEEELSQTSRNIQLYLLLNTDVSIIQDDLINDVNFSHLVKTAPTLSKSLLIEVVWNASLEAYLSEAITFGPAVLSDELLRTVLDSLSSLSPYPRIKKASSILCAVYLKLKIASCKDKSHDKKCLPVLKRFFSLFKSLLAPFKSTDPAEFQKWSCEDLLKFAGHVLSNMLSILKKCLSYCYSNMDVDKKMMHFYAISESFDYSTWSDNTESRSCDILEQCNMLLFEVCRMNFSSVSVDAWIFWNECNVEHSERTLQANIGNEAYLCIDLLKGAAAVNPSLEIIEELKLMLSSIAVKPRDEDDEIAEADIQTIMKNIPNKRKTQAKWMKAFLNSDLLLTNSECLKCIEENVHLLQDDDIKELLVKTVLLLEAGNNQGLRENVKHTVLLSVKSLNLESQKIVLSFFFTKFGITTVLQMENFNSSALNIFNKAVNSEEEESKNFSDFIWLCLQSPREVVQRILLMGINSNRQLTLVVDILLHLRSVCEMVVHNDVAPKKEAHDNGCTVEDHSRTSLLVDIFINIVEESDWSDQENNNVIQMVIRLVNNSILDGTEFMTRLLLPAFHEATKSSDWPSVIFWLQALQPFVNNAITSKPAIRWSLVIVMLGQLLEVSRWDISTFSVERATVCDEALKLVETLVDEIVCGKENIDSEVLWLRENLKSRFPLNKYYYCKIWSKFGYDVNPPKDIAWFGIYLVHCESSIKEIRNETQQAIKLLSDTPILLVYSLYMVLPLCTTKEWRQLAYSLKSFVACTIKDGNEVLFVLGLFIDALLLLINVVKEFCKDDPCAYSCLEFSVRNLGYILKDEVIPHMKSLPAEGALMAFQQVIHVQQQLPKEVWSCSSVMMGSVLTDMMSSIVGKVKRNITEDTQEKHLSLDAALDQFCVSISIVPDIELRKALSTKLLDIL